MISETTLEATVNKMAPKSDAADDIKDAYQDACYKALLLVRDSFCLCGAAHGGFDTVSALEHYLVSMTHGRLKTYNRTSRRLRAVTQAQPSTVNAFNLNTILARKIIQEISQNYGTHYVNAVLGDITISMLARKEGISKQTARNRVNKIKEYYKERYA